MSAYQSGTTDFPRPSEVLPDEDVEAVWKAIAAHALGSKSVEVHDWSVEDTKKFLLGKPERLVFVQLDRADRVVVLVDPGAVVSAIERAFDQGLMHGFDFAVLPRQLNWCVVGNDDGEIFFCTRLG